MSTIALPLATQSGIIPRLTTVLRLGLSLGSGDAGYMVYDTTLSGYYFWTGSAWTTIGGGAGTGNWAFSGNNADLTAPGTLGIGLATATGITIGSTTTPTTVAGDLTLGTGSASASGTVTITSGASNTAATAFSLQATANYGSSYSSFPLLTIGTATYPAFDVRVTANDGICLAAYNPHGGATTAQSYLWMTPSGFLMEGNFGAMLPLGVGNITTNGNDLTYSIGTSTDRRSEVWARRYAGVEQTVAAAATITLDPAAGESIRITLSATAVTTVNGAAGLAGERMTVQIIQDAGGSKSISGWATGTNGFKLAGGAYTPTSAGSARDAITFIWDTVASMWVETSRSMNM